MDFSIFLYEDYVIDVASWRKISENHWSQLQNDAFLELCVIFEIVVYFLARPDIYGKWKSPKSEKTRFFWEIIGFSVGKT